MGVGEIPAELLRSLGQRGNNRLFKLASKIYETGEVPSDFKQSTIVTIPKLTHADKYEDYRTISLVSHASKLITKIVCRRIENKIDNELDEDQFGFRKSRGTREAILTLRLLIEGRLKKNKDTYMASVDLEKSFDNVNWNKMFEILRTIGLRFRDRGIIYNLYKDQVAIIRVEDQERQASIKKGVRQGCSLSPLLFNMYVEEAMKKLKEEFAGGVKIQGEEIKMLRFADDIILLAEREEELGNILNGMDRLLREEFELKIN